MPMHSIIRHVRRRGQDNQCTVPGRARHKIGGKPASLQPTHVFFSPKHLQHWITFSPFSARRRSLFGIKSRARFPRGPDYNRASHLRPSPADGSTDSPFRSELFHFLISFSGLTSFTEYSTGADGWGVFSAKRSFLETFLQPTPTEYVSCQEFDGVSGIALAAS
jgi:hypothetical protein